MEFIKNKLVIEIDPGLPVKEVCEVISAVCAYHPGNEDKVLKGIQEAIDKRLLEIENAKQEPSAE